MNLGELETVTTYGLPVKVVVLNNIGDGMVRQWQKLFFRGRFASSATRACTRRISSRRRRPTASNGHGGWSARRNWRDAIADFLAFDGPAFLEVMIDPDAGVYPMVGPGATYAQMITGDFIPSRAAAEASGDSPSDMF